MIAVDCTFESDLWRDEASLAVLAETAIEAAIPMLEFTLPQSCEISLLFANDQRVQSLNREWRHQDKPTNVLSFATNEGLKMESWSPLLGDIVLAQETIAIEAADQAKDFNDHLSHLIVHGFLHLIGYDHQNDTEAEQMERLETTILASLKISDPYRLADI